MKFIRGSGVTMIKCIGFVGVSYKIPSVQVLQHRRHFVHHIGDWSAANLSCHIVDLRSDTVTQPSVAMKEAMMKAPLGDDVFGEDPTVLALQVKVADLLEKDAALFVPSGTMANLICILGHCWGRGAEMIVGNKSHIYLSEQAGSSQIGGVHTWALTNKTNGTFCLEEMTEAVRKSRPHNPITSLVCAENTHNYCGGKALPLEWLNELGERCVELGIPLHMDGARLMNAATALQVPPARLVKHSTSVSFCLSKGLGAPAGSVVAGPHEFITRAIRLRKVLGGGMRQVGLLAAAGIYGLDHVAPLLLDDHRHAKLLAQAVWEARSNVVKVNLEDVHTNIVKLEIQAPNMSADDFCKRMSSITEDEMAVLGEHTIAKIAPLSSTTAKMVTHCNITSSDVSRVRRKLAYVLKELE
ncbi:uncharacterized protein LOC143030574 isoform X2 [Oratosquilla oratoria]